MTPGPNSVLIARTVPVSGRPAGMAAIVGVASALFLHGTFSIFGISILLLRSAELFLVFKVLGAGYLCWMGAQALWQAWRHRGPTPAVAPARRPRTLIKAYSEGFLTNALNPKVSLFYLAAFPQFMPPGGTAL